ncbi:MAG: NAD-dependent succinate-semialdehyde dehydrogenase [Rhodobacteraceae bacterium]|nr:NAD-dependent succinate-semialdehyde dehydrogenase [Paracoccaceae bacterium]
MNPDLPAPRLFIDGNWIEPADRATHTRTNPANGRILDRLPHATAGDLDLALNAASRSFPAWAAVHPRERARILRHAAETLRQRADTIARAATLEMGKPVTEAKIEVAVAADEMDWLAEEGRRVYGRIIPGLSDGAELSVLHEPIGPSAAFAAWNFPVVNAVRKIASSLAAGCPCIYKPGEEVAVTSGMVVRALAEAGVPAGVVALVFGVPGDISEHLIASPIIRKVSFTGSVAVGRHLMMLAARGMKATTMELGGHAPVLILADADIGLALDLSAKRKYRNAGQVCVSPTRFFVEDAVFQQCCDGFGERAEAVRVGDGLDPATEMGPLIHARRLRTIEELVADALDHGATLVTGGARIGNAGNFYAPTVLANVPDEARIMNEEPFGPVAIINRAADFEDAIAQANRLDYGLAAYAFSRDGRRLREAGLRLRAGMVGLNSYSISTPETPFGGLDDSGHGSELGIEGLTAYFTTKTISRAD